MKTFFQKLFIGLRWTALLMIASPAMAEIPMDEQAVATGGFGKWLISVLFEAGTADNQPDSAGIVGSVIQPFSLVCMLVIVGIIVVKSVQHILIVAQAKDVESSPIAMTWAPLHLIIAVALAMPLPSGYSMGQYTAIWVAKQSNLLGNMTASRAIGDADYTVTTEVPLPSVRTTIQGIVDSHVCMVLMNTLGEYTRQQGGAGLQVRPRTLTSAEIERVAGAPKDIYSEGEAVSRKGVIFEAQRTGSGGDFANQPTGLNSICGTVVVEYDSYYADDDYVDLGLADAGDNQTSSDAGGPCGGGIMCEGALWNSTRSDDKKKVAAAFKNAHTTIENLFLRASGYGGTPSPNIRAAVDELTYDVEDYFSSLVDPEAQDRYLEKQMAEAARVEEAAKRVVKEIDEMQSGIYAAYGGALNTLRSESSQTGDSHKDSVLRSGWPVLGLYWFQQESYNSQVLKTTNFNASARMSAGNLIRVIEAATDDKEFAERMANRLTAYRNAVNRMVLNTRLDPDPLSGTATGGVANSAQPRGNQFAAAEMRETLPTYISAMVEASQNEQGALTSDSMGGFGVSHFFRNLIFPLLVNQLREDNLVTGLVDTGHTLIMVSEAVYLTQLMARTTEKWIEKGESESFTTSALKLLTGVGAVDKGAQKVAAVGFGTWFGTLAVEFLRDLSPLIAYMFFLGVFLAFYLPAVVMVQWIIGLVQWMIYIIEANVVIPLWAILFASDMGQKAFAPQTAQQGLIHLVSILFYPALMVIGFTIGIKILDVAGTFLIDYIMIGFLGMTTGYTFGIVSTLAGITLIGIVAYQVIMRIFSAMLELNDRAIGWIGNRATFGENNSEQAARSAMVAIMGRGENMAGRSSMNNKKPPSSPGNMSRPE